MWAAYGKIRYFGDASTPGESSYIGAAGLPLNEIFFPKIPVQPISYGQAKELLQRLQCW